MSQQELESYLWGAAKLLRGLIDAGDYKQFIFPLLFFKRLSRRVGRGVRRGARRDRATTAYARATAERPLRDPRRRALDATCAAPRATSAGRCSTAFRAIEAANPERLDGVFGDAPWTDKAQLPDETLQEPDRALLAGRRSASRTCPRTSSATATST